MPIITVSQLNNYMKRYVDQNIHLSDLWIKGEISNLKIHYNGHIYLTLKDENSSVKVVMFKSFADKLRFSPQDGNKVIAFGKIGVFEREGVYQLYAESLIPDGKGELYAAYERLKNDLENEGLFDDKHKREIPIFPKCIGIITSISGAALRDIMNVISRRYRLADICIYPVKVQGLGASESICKALEYFSGYSKCDVIILSRGGGSIEDLWAFNEEKTARAIFACNKPVICGVGHETDYTISDFVSDMRAPTPSVAAELATPSANEIIDKIMLEKNNINNIMINYIDNLFEAVSFLDKEKLYKCISEFRDKRQIDLQSQKLKLINSFYDISSSTLNKLTMLSASVSALDPKKVLKRGYSVVTDFDGKTLSLSDINSNDEIKAIFDGGYAKCKVLEVNHEK